MCVSVADVLDTRRKLAQVIQFQMDLGWERRKQESSPELGKAVEQSEFFGLLRGDHDETLGLVRISL